MIIAKVNENRSKVRCKEERTRNGLQGAKIYKREDLKAKNLEATSWKLLTVLRDLNNRLITE